MRKRYILAGIGGLIMGAVLLSGCSSTVSANVPEVLQVRTVDAAKDGTVSIESRETVKVTPDMAEIVFAVLTEKEDAAACQQENTEKLNQFIEYLKGQGYAETSIKTSDFSLNPKYDWSGNTQKLVGYEMRTQVTVTDVPLEQSGALLSGGVANGANEIQSVSYFSSTYDESYNEALKKAVELARGKAEALAAASGNTVGKVLNIQEYGDSQNGRYVSAGMGYSAKNLAAGPGAARAEMDMSVMPGEMEITANVSVLFEMTPRK